MPKLTESWARTVSALSAARLAFVRIDDAVASAILEFPSHFAAAYPDQAATIATIERITASAIVIS